MLRCHSHLTPSFVGWLAPFVLHLSTPANVRAEAPDPGLYASAMAPIQPLHAQEAAALVEAGLPLHLSMTLNGRHMGLQPAQLRAGQALWMQQGVLASMGLNLHAIPANSQQEDGWLALNTLGDTTLRFDAAAQTLSLLVPFAWLDWDSTALSAHAWQPLAPSASTGLLLNYDVYGLLAPGRNGPRSLSAATELRAFRANTVLSHTMLSRAHPLRAQETTDPAESRRRHTRLDTTLVHSMPDSMHMLRLGDTLTARQPWSRATRIGGLQIGTHFGLQPYRPTTPMAVLTGTAAMPAGVELFIDGVRQYQGQVPAGPFTLTTLPGLTGNGQAQLVMTDMLGRHTTMEYNLYGNSQLLAKGLSDWSVELGRIREQYGLRSFQYGTETLASFTLSHGVTNTLTLQGHAELTGTLRNAGVGGLWAWGRWGATHLAAAHSAHRGLSGTLLQAGHNYSSRKFHASLEASRSSTGYRDAAALHEAQTTRSMAHALVGFNTRSWGSISAGLMMLSKQIQGARRYATLSWNKSLGQRVQVALNVHHNLRNRQQSSVQLLLNWYLDDDISTGVSLQQTDHRSQLTLHASQRLPQNTGWSWSGSTQQGAHGNAQMHVNYRAQSAELNGALARTGNETHASFGASGALAWLSGLGTTQVFTSRRITDSFAVVDTDGMADVPVRRDNAPVGVTDARGQLLVPQLGAYRNNRLSIDPTQLPAQTRVATVEQVVSPTDRAGVAVRFALQRTRAASIVLHDGSARPLPLGTRVRLWHEGDTSPGAHQPTTPQGQGIVGYDGAVYFETLGRQNRLHAITPENTTCSARVAWRHSMPNEIPVIGPIPCE